MAGVICARAECLAQASRPAAASAPAATELRVATADQLPPDAVIEGVAIRGRETVYLYRSPTRVENWERTVTRKLGLPLGGGRDNAPPGYLWNVEAQERAQKMLWIAVGGAAGLLLAIIVAAWLVGRLVRSARARRIARSEPKAADPPPLLRPSSPVISGSPRGFANAASMSSDPLDTKLKGSLSHIGLEAVLQVLAGVGKTGVLVVSDAKGRTVGRISLKEGQLLEITAGKEQGVAALAKILSLESGDFRLRDLTSMERWRLRGREKTDLIGLLLDAHRIMDERAAAVETP